MSVSLSLRRKTEFSSIGNAARTYSTICPKMSWYFTNTTEQKFVESYKVLRPEVIWHLRRNKALEIKKKVKRILHYLTTYVPSAIHSRNV